MGRGRRTRAGHPVRVPVRRVHGLLDVVGEAELETRRVERTPGIGPPSWPSSARGPRAAAGRCARRRRCRRSSARTSTRSWLWPTGAGVGPRAARLAGGRAEPARAGPRRVRWAWRWCPVRRVVASFPQLVREVARETGKDVQLVLEGEDVELDARVLDGVADALGHLVTNAVDHGCETAGASGRRPGKPAGHGHRGGARRRLHRRHRGVRRRAGIDEQALRASAVQHGLLAPEAAVIGQPLLSLLFHPGFSTRDEVTETSGRGVGLDVVRTAVEDLGGTVEIETEPGAGTPFVMTLPVTLGVMRCLVARLGDERYAVPVTNVVETLSLTDVATQTVAGAPVLVRHGSTVPLADLGARWACRGERDAARRRGRSLRRRRRAARVGGRRPRGRAGDGRQGPGRRSWAGCRRSAAARSTATAA